MLPIIKIPFILIAMVGFHVAVTPPEPPSIGGETVESTMLEFLLKQRFPPIFVKCVCWGIALAELNVLLARIAPNYLSNSDSILIFRDGAAERIHPSGFFFVGSFLTALGGFIRFKCYKALGKMFTFEMTVRKDHKLVTTGPYKLVRHPGYSGVLLTIVGLLLLHGSEGSWIRESGVMESAMMQGIIFLTSALVCTITIGLLQRMAMEDKSLHNLAGEEWENWARRVPFKLIPWIY